MSRKPEFIIPDCYTKESRDHFDRHGVTYAGELYAQLLVKYMKEAAYDIFFSSDPGVTLPAGEEVSAYAGIIWPGCNLTVYHEDDERVTKLVNLSKDAYAYGVPQFGSCWGIQMAVFAAGGMVEANPRGREMGMARKIYLTNAGKVHPMMKGKPPVYDGFVSHDDMITKMPEGGTILASNDFTPVQAVEVRYKKGIFWATQYHPEMDLRVMARLISAREEKLMKQGYFRSHQEMVDYVKDLETAFTDPSRKDLRWKYDIDDTVLSEDIRQLEFVNWINEQVLPTL